MLRKLIKSRKIGKTVVIKTGYYYGCVGTVKKYVPSYESHFNTMPEGYMVYVEDVLRLPRSLRFFEEKELEFL